jgi:hypothetical protein
VKRALLCLLFGACAYAREGGPDAACQLVPTGGCPVGEACSVDPATAAEGTVACRTITAEGAPLAACALESECAAGLTCQGGRCLAYCRGDGDCDGAGALCVVPAIFGSVLADGIRACTPDCDPLTSARCPAALGCQLVKEPIGTRFHTDCTAAGTGTQLATCAANADCAPGYVCQSSDGSLVCLRRCVIGSACDVPDAVCTAQTGRPTIGGTEYGVCLP